VPLARRDPRDLASRLSAEQLRASWASSRASERLPATALEANLYREEPDIGGAAPFQGRSGFTGKRVMPRFVVPMWSPRPDQVRRELRAASIGVLGEAVEETRGLLRRRVPTNEIRATLVAASRQAALAEVRKAVGHDAAVVGAETVRNLDSAGGLGGKET
jgi:hypothetical protein